MSQFHHPLSFPFDVRRSLLDVRAIKFCSKLDYVRCFCSLFFRGVGSIKTHFSSFVVRRSTFALLILFSKIYIRRLFVEICANFDLANELKDARTSSNERRTTNNKNKKKKMHDPFSTLDVRRSTFAQLLFLIKPIFDVFWANFGDANILQNALFVARRSLLDVRATTFFE